MLSAFWYSFIGIFVAIDVVGVLPMYLGMTQSLNPDRKIKTINQSVIVAFWTAFIFLFIGRYIFKGLGISIHDFKVGGGIVLLVISILELISRKSEADPHTTSTGIVPLAVPLITGPALLTTVMLQVSLYGNLVVLGALLANFLIAWIVLRQGQRVTKLVGEEGTNIFSKIAALFMTAIAFSMIRAGVFEAIGERFHR